MAANFFPLKDQDLVTWSGNYSGLITANPTQYNLLASDATALGLLQSTFADAVLVAKTPETRTKVTVRDMSIAKVQLVAMIRSTARRIQAYPGVTASMKDALGLPVHSLTPTPIGVPTTQPVVTVVAIRVGRQILRITDEATPTRRAKPSGVAGAEVFTFVTDIATQPPADLSLWRSEGLATRSDFEINFQVGDAGKMAHIVARWFNSKGEFGPLSDRRQSPIAAVPPAAGVSAAGKPGEGNLGLAA